MSGRAASARAAGLVCLLLLVFGLWGCAGKTVAPSGPGAEEAAKLWQSFTARKSETGIKAFSASASLAYSTPQRSTRLTLKLWGDLNGPLRLDFSSGIGVTFSSWLEDSSGWLAYFPMDRLAYTHRETRLGARKLGMPLPVNLRELSGLLMGRFSEFIPLKYQSFRKTKQGIEYHLGSSGPFSSITLDFEAKPIHLTGQGNEPWGVELSDYEPSDLGLPLAKGVTLSSPGGLKAVLRIKKLDFKPEPWPAAALSLALPGQTVTYSLEKSGDFQKPNFEDAIH